MCIHFINKNLTGILFIELIFGLVFYELNLGILWNKIQNDL